MSVGLPLDAPVVERGDFADGVNRSGVALRQVEGADSDVGRDAGIEG